MESSDSLKIAYYMQINIEVKIYKIIDPENILRDINDIHRDFINETLNMIGWEAGNGLILELCYYQKKRLT